MNEHLHTNVSTFAHVARRLPSSDPPAGGREQHSPCDELIAALRQQIVEARKELRDKGKDNEGLQDEVSSLRKQLAAMKLQHAPCHDIISGLRNQIQDTLSAVHQDDLVFAKTKSHAVQLHQDLQVVASCSTILT